MTIQTITRTVRTQDDAKARIPHTAHLRELKLPDGRKLLLDRRSIAFLCEGKPEEFAGKVVTVVGFKTMAKACPVAAGYQDLKTWWHGDQVNTTGGQSGTTMSSVLGTSLSAENVTEKPHCACGTISSLHKEGATT